MKPDAFGDQSRMVSTMPRLSLFVVLVLSACPYPYPQGQQPGTGGAPLTCPDQLQCPCDAGCPSPQICGPHNACTIQCTEDDECGSLSGEHCIAGLCGVSCDPYSPNDCEVIGMDGATCMKIQGTAVCGYPQATADDTM